MAPSPIPWLLIVMASSLFQAMLYGNPLSDQAVEYESYGDDPPSGLDIIAEIIAVIWETILLFLRFLIFPIPGAPEFIRLLLGFFNGGVIVWSVVTLLRGN